MGDFAGYIILSTQRTGSHLLGDILGSHPAFAQAGEVLIPGTRKRGSFDKYIETAKSTSDNPATVLDDFLDHLRSRRPTASYVGFLVKYGHADRIGGQDLTVDPAFARIRIIHLVRRNLLRLVASHRLAAARKVHVSRRPVRHKVNSVSLNTKTLVDSLRSRREQIEEMSAKLTGRPGVLEVAYEEIMSGSTVSQACLSRLTSFFGASNEFRNDPATVRLAPVRLPDLIANYTDVARILRGTEFERMLD